MKRAVVLLALVMGGLVIGSCPARAEPVRIAAEPVQLHPQKSSQNRVGVLLYRGGLALTSPDPRFGGFSALGISADGRRMVALSDKGMRFSARVVYDENANLAGLDDADLGSMSGLDGRPLTASSETDAESMSPGVDGEIIVAFERHHRLWRYFPGRPLPQPLPPPVELASAPSNGGIEALTLLDDGRLLAITENFSMGGSIVGWVSDRGGWSVLIYETKPGFHPTGAATLPGGDVVVLERLFRRRGSEATRLTRLDAASIAPGARLTPSELALIRPPLTVDNFEGVEARRGEGGETLIYIISDDNFRAGQRTLLLMFELVP